MKTGNPAKFSVFKFLLFGLFFIAYMLVIAWWVKPTLLYHNHLQYLTQDIHLGSVISHVDPNSLPGDFLHSLAGLGIHYSSNTWTGAAIIAFFSLGIFLLCRFYLYRLFKKQLSFVSYILPLFLLYLCVQYTFRLEDQLNVFLSLAGVTLIIGFRKSKPLLVSILIIGLSMLIYIISPAALWPFSALSIIFLLYAQKQLVPALITLACAILIPAIFIPFFTDLTLLGAFHQLAFWQTPETIVKWNNLGTLQLFIPALSFLLIILHFIFRRISSMIVVVKPIRMPKAVSTIAAVILLGLIVGYASDVSSKRIRLIKYYSQYNRYAELLQEADQLPAADFDLTISHLVIRALYHEGRLLSDLFAYPVTPEAILLRPAEQSTHASLLMQWLYSARTWLDLGAVNVAEDFAYEALAILRYYPLGLKLQAEINIIKGMPDAAQAYLLMLNEDFAHRESAQLMLNDFKEWPKIRTQLAQIQLTHSTKDSIDPVSIPDLYLANPSNKMAFEYLIISFLLSNDIEIAVGSIEGLRSLGYEKIPPLLEIAALIYQRNSDKQPPLHGYTISDEAQAQFAAFDAAFAKHSYDKQKAQADLAKNHGNNLMFYYLYGFVPEVE